MLKKSLGEVIADQLSNEIRSGRRQGVMASETDLAIEFQTSRRSVRIALTILEGQGLVGPASRSRPRHIVYQLQSEHAQRQTTRIGIFTHKERSLLSSSSQTMLRILRQGLDAAEYAHQFFTLDYSIGGSFSKEKVWRYCDQYNPDVWLVLVASDPLLSILLATGKPVVALGGYGELLSRCPYHSLWSQRDRSACKASDRSAWTRKMDIPCNGCGLLLEPRTD